MPVRAVQPSSLDITQAYQTVQAQLTQANVTPSVQPGNDPPTATNEDPSTLGPTQPSVTSTLKARCDQAAAAYPKIDISIDDDTDMMPGEKFTKIWRVVNVGTCTWMPDYDIVFFSGEQMLAPASISLIASVPPNQSVDFSVDMVAPSQPGKYQGNWKIRNTDGLLFGIGPDGESPFWVRIKVLEVATKTPAPSPTSTSTVPAQADGPATMVISDTLDLDNLLVNAGGVDLVYTKTANDPPQHQLTPIGNVTLGFYGGTQPTLGDCLDTSLADTPITLNELALGSFLCYQTDLSLPGWVRIDAFDPDAGTLTLQVFTWKLP